jgi:hypothetical protein
MHTKLTLITAASVLASACSGLQPVDTSEPEIPITTYSSPGKVTEGGAVYLWPPYSSAAVVDGKGNRCVLTASGAKTTKSKADDALKIGDLMGKLQGLDVSRRKEFEELFVKLTSADSKAAFVDVALFHLCMFDQNGTFKEHKKDDDGVMRDHTFKAKLVQEAYLATIKAAAGTP